MLATNKIGSNRKFGIELETSESPGYTAGDFAGCFEGKYDGSVCGLEFVSPVLSGDAGYAAVVDTCRALNNRHCSVNSSCGYHLHCDLRNTTDAQRAAIALAYALTEDFWFGCVDSRRHNNSYCERIGNGDYGWDKKTAYTAQSNPRPSSRYCWCNWCSYNKHETLEIRLHHGTIDATATINWVKAHLRFIDSVAVMTVGQIRRKFSNKSVADQKRNMRDVWLSSDLAAYYGC